MRAQKLDETGDNAGVRPDTGDAARFSATAPPTYRLEPARHVERDLRRQTRPSARSCEAAHTSSLAEPASIQEQTGA